MSGELVRTEPDVASLPESPDRLDPAEDLFDPLSDPLADRVARLVRRSPVDHRPSMFRDVLSDVRRNVARATVRDEVARIVALVAGERDASRARDVVVYKVERVAPLGTAVGNVHLQIDDQPVAVLHQRVRRVTELCLFAAPFAREHGI